MKYSFDTNFIINLHKFYPEDIFKSLWSNIDILIEDQRIISPREVFNELSKKDDNAYSWAKRIK